MKRSAGVGMLLTVVVIAGCRATAPAARTATAAQEGSDQGPGGYVLPPAFDYFGDGFSVRRELTEAESQGGGECALCGGDDDFGAHQYAVVTPEGRDLVTGEPADPAMFALDQETKWTIAGRYAVFTWPAAGERINRDYRRLNELMTEYSSLVGKCLERDLSGRGERAWAASIRWEQHRTVEAARLQGPRQWCNVVVQQLVNRFVPSGSQYLQYGNCGEGGKVGACLALRAGFQPSEVRVCQSREDHFFAMVKDTGNQRLWCVMDRWNVNSIGVFRCDADFDPATRTLGLLSRTGDGAARLTPVPHKWYTQLNCVTLAEYLRDPATLDRW